MTNVLVLGATGKTGQAICKYLGENKIQYSVFVRGSSKESCIDQTVNMIFGDVLDAKSIQKAIASQTFTDVVIALGARDLKGLDIRFNGTKNTVSALNELNQELPLHIISAHGVGESWQYLNWFEKLISNLLIKKTMQDHTKQEEIARANKGGFHIVRAVALQNKPATHNVIELTESKMPNGSITREDLAEFLVLSLIKKKRGEVSVCAGG